MLNYYQCTPAFTRFWSQRKDFASSGKNYFKCKDYSCKLSMQKLCNTPLNLKHFARNKTKQTLEKQKKNLCFISLCRFLFVKGFISKTTTHLWSLFGLHRRLWRTWHEASFKSVLVHYHHHLAAVFDASKDPSSGSPAPSNVQRFKSQMAKQMSDCFCPFLLWPKYKQTAEPLK